MRLFILVVLLIAAVSAGIPTKCPQVFDGLTHGRFDVETQFNGNSLSANWIGLPSHEVTRYECAIISEKQLTNKMLTECRSTPGFSGLPDVRSWVNVNKDTSITIKKLNLNPSTTYFIILRTTLSNGEQVYSNSNGVKFLVKEVNQTEEESVREVITLEASQKKSRATRDEDFVCPLDEANRCRVISVQQYLNEIYGKPVRFVPTYNDDDDDDWNPAGAIVGGVFGGVFLLCCLLLCLLGLLALLATGFSNSESPFSEDIISVTSDPIDADLGSTTQHHLVGADTRVEFPDLDPSSRLN